MAHYINHIELWSKNNSMKLNFKKTKEMILVVFRKILQHRSVLMEMLLIQSSASNYLE